MGDLHSRFSRSEFECMCGCKKDTVDYELLSVLIKLADYFENQEKDTKQPPVVITHINSGFRCKEHNKAIGGSPNSQHLLGKAADFWMEYKYPNGHKRKIKDNQIFETLNALYPNKYGIGRYEGRTHIDVRNTKARWDKR